MGGKAALLGTIWTGQRDAWGALAFRVPSITASVTRTWQPDAAAATAPSALRVPLCKKDGLLGELWEDLPRPA